MGTYSRSHSPKKSSAVTKGLSRTVPKKEEDRSPQSDNEISENSPLQLGNLLGNVGKNSSQLGLPTGGVLQTKLAIGKPNDRYEQEADRVAQTVVQQLRHPTAVSNTQGDIIQSKGTANLGIQSKVGSTSGGEASTELSGAINQAKGGGQPLNESLQQSLGQTMGADFSQVRIHTDRRSHELNQSLQARAFTTGQNVFFRQGEYNPNSRNGQELIAHELTHVKQQEKVASIQRDVVEDIVLEGDKDEIKDDLVSCINKFKAAINKVRDEVTHKDALNEVLAESGRDAFFYRRIWWKNKHGLEGDLNRWERSWSIARTGGLLADLGLALRHIPSAIFTGGLKFDDIMNDYLRQGSDHVRGRDPKIDRSDWSDDIDKSELEGNAGPSSTTTQLLHVVSSIGTFTNTEVEAMMMALVRFWKGKLKRQFGGGFHTAAEVWAPYTGYLEAQKPKDD